MGLRFSAIWRELPSLIILGAQKCGTTSLHKYLSRHPHFAGPYLKEVHYFDNNFGRSLYWYRSHFRPARSRISFEATPYYLFHPAVPGRIRHTLPETKFVVMLRDPVARAISHYHHVVSQGLEKLPIEAAFRAEQDRINGAEQALTASRVARVINHQRYSYVSRSLYSQQIERWLDHFPRSRFLFLTSERMFDNPQWALDAVSGFMEVPSYRLGNASADNQRVYPEAPRATREFIREKVADDSARIAGIIGFTPEWA
jgi:hypothetical protein